MSESEGESKYESKTETGVINIKSSQQSKLVKNSLQKKIKDYIKQKNNNFINQFAW